MPALPVIHELIYLYITGPDSIMIVDDEGRPHVIKFRLNNPNAWIRLIGEYNYNWDWDDYRMPVFQMPYGFDGVLACATIQFVKEVERGDYHSAQLTGLGIRNIVEAQEKFESIKRK